MDANLGSFFLEESGVLFVKMRGREWASFLFLYFSKKNLQKYILDFRFYSSIPLPPGRGAVGIYM